MVSRYRHNAIVASRSVSDIASSPAIWPAHRQLWTPCQRSTMLPIYRSPISNRDNVMNRHPMELMKGTLDLLILKTLALEPRHGVGIADRIGAVPASRVPGQAGLTLPGAASARAGRIHPRGMERNARRTSREVL